ncbi:TPA: restriction endonuclease subunit S [Yersinia enterocolitica]|uniref:restriction endonuclease subunit S n=1 Tax=Yersinia enterocolitica TaxID=630 RepID=UPI00294749A4|nr:restriction endonuclease subunit S [Yersinia enterocolitica]HED4494265.1 restriction endonuclease subunit S [Yersinia enterocolitica]
MSWPMISLGELVDIKGGGTPDKSNSEYWNGEIPWASVKDFKKNTLDSTFDSITPLGVKNSATSVIPAGNIIVPTRMALGKVAINTIDLAINQDLKALFIKDNNVVDRDYLFRWLESQSSLIESEGKGATVKGITLPFLRGLNVPIPPLSEQKRIAVILDKAERIRRKREQAIKLAGDFLRSTFLAMFGDPVSNPKGWKVKPLKELSVKIASGSTPKGGSKVYVDKGITFFRSQNVWKNDIRLDGVAYIDEKTHSSLKKSTLKHKDILMTKTGRFNTENSSLGRAALFLGEDDSANVNGHVYLIRLKSEMLHEFIVYILTSNEYREHIREVCVGGIDKRQLNKEHIEDFPIICPPDDLQKEFMRKLNSIQKIRSNAMTGLKEVIPLFNTLNQKAFSDGF